MLTYSIGSTCLPILSTSSQRTKISFTHRPQTTLLTFARSTGLQKCIFEHHGFWCLLTTKFICCAQPNECNFPPISENFTHHHRLLQRQAYENRWTPPAGLARLVGGIANGCWSVRVLGGWKNWRRRRRLPLTGAAQHSMFQPQSVLIGTSVAKDNAALIVQAARIGVLVPSLSFGKNRSI